MKFKTMSVHSGQRIDPQTGALTTPLYQSSTFSYFNAQAGKERFAGQAPGFIYSRFGNPTTAELEQKLAALEGADEALVVASGMAAVSAIMYALADSGDEVAYIGPLYGGTDAFLKQTFSRAGIKITAYESDQALLANIRPATKVVLFETLTNPTLKVVDPRVVAEAARKVGAITVCDNTFLTPYLLRPLELGIDIVMHSGTKYLGGHGDIIAGVVAGRHELMKSIRTVALKHIGSPIGPQEAYLPGDQDPSPAHGCPPAQRPEGGRVPGCPPGGEEGDLPGPCQPSGPRCPRRLRQRLWRHGEHRAGRRV